MSLLVLIIVSLNTPQTPREQLEIIWTKEELDDVFGASFDLKEKFKNEEPTRVLRDKTLFMINGDPEFSIGRQIILPVIPIEEGRGKIREDLADLFT